MDPIVPEQFQEFRIGLKLHSEDAAAKIEKLWRSFFTRIKSFDHPVDRAVWLCLTMPEFVAVKPGSPSEDPYEEPGFVLSTRVVGLRERSECLRAQVNSEQEYRKLFMPFKKKYYAWLRAAIKKSFQSESVQSLKKSLIKGRFGAYTTQIENIQSDELDEMDWLVGSRLR